MSPELPGLEGVSPQPGTKGFVPSTGGGKRQQGMKGTTNTSSTYQVHGLSAKERKKEWLEHRGSLQAPCALSPTLSCTPSSSLAPPQDAHAGADARALSCREQDPKAPRYFLGVAVVGQTCTFVGFLIFFAVFIIL